jgi:hypothetical protein
MDAKLVAKHYMDAELVASVVDASTARMGYHAHKCAHVLIITAAI